MNSIYENIGAASAAPIQETGRRMTVETRNAKQNWLNMNRHFKPAYYFIATPYSNRPDIFILSLIGANSAEFKNGNREKTPAEIVNVHSWDLALLSLKGHESSIVGCAEDYTAKDNAFHEPIIRFYAQRDDLFFGECCDTRRSILARMYGQRDENGILIPEIVSLSVSNIRFDTINVFNHPSSDHAECWEEALKAKWETPSRIAA